MKFKYYVVSLFEGNVFGTNSDEEAEELAKFADEFVVDSSTGEWLMSDGTRQKIEKLDYSDE